MAAGQWLTAADEAEVEAYWPGALEETTQHGAYDPVGLDALLASARIQCEAYAPALANEAPVPGNYRHAQVLQARDLFRAGLHSQDNGIGADGMVITTFPMTWHVKALLRPKKGGLWVR